MKYKIVVFNSQKEFDNIYNLNESIYEKEEEAKEDLVKYAKEFYENIKKDGNLINLNRISDNSIKIDYVGKNGDQSFCIYQVLKFDSD